MKKKKKKETRRPEAEKDTHTYKKSKYDPDVHPALAAQMKQDGHTNDEIAAALGITRRTLTNWCKEHEELRKAIKLAREVMCAKVRNSLYESCFEHTVEETRIIREFDKELKELKVVRVEQFRRVVPPNTLAQQILLYNCDPEHFRRNPSAKVDLGKDPLAALLEGIKDRQKEQESPPQEESANDGTVRSPNVDNSDSVSETD